MNKRQQYPITTPQAIIFDMDGTLIDSTEADYLAWKKLFAEQGIALTFEHYFTLLGIRSMDLVQTQLALEGDAVKEALARKHLYFKEVVAEKGLQIIPHVIELLDYLRTADIKIALATSSRKEKMRMVMEHTNLLQYFNVTVTGDEIANGKPAPDIFLKAAARLGIPAAGCLVFEDAVSGVRAAKNAGMQCIAISNTHPAELLHEADLVISSYTQLDKSRLGYHVA